MDKQERFRDFKRKVMVKLTNEEGIPQEIENIISTSFNGIENRYEDLQCSSSTIREYIEGNLQSARYKIDKYLNENRKGSQMQYMQAFMRKIEQEVENESITQDTEEHQQEIEEMDSENGKTTERISSIIQDQLKNIQSYQNRVLNNYGYSMNRIEDIQQEAIGYMNRLIRRNQNEIYEVLQQDSRDFKEWLMEEYQNYVRQEEIEEKKKDEKEEKTGEKTQREEFMESLDAGISLEDQSKAAEERKVEERKVEERTFDMFDENFII